MCLHEDWESHGFYIYELNPDGHAPLGEKIVAAVARVCPIDLSPEIEGREARGGVIRPSLDPAVRRNGRRHSGCIKTKRAGVARSRHRRIFRWRRAWTRS